MRWIACMPLILVAAACGGGEAENKSAAKASALSAGQWELTTEVTAFNKADQGPTPAIDTPVGTRATESVCVASGRPPGVFYGGGDYQCRYENHYARNGRLNMQLTCTREGLPGYVSVTTSGTFEAESAEFTREIRTVLSGDGDVAITQRVTARRTGECVPETAGNESAAANESAPAKQ